MRGYTRGSGGITNAPNAANLKHTTSSGDLTLVIDDPATSVAFVDIWRTWNFIDKNCAPTSTSTSATSTTEQCGAGAIAGLAASYDDLCTQP